jgi:hypothetical protein
MILENSVTTSQKLKYLHYKDKPLNAVHGNNHHSESFPEHLNIMCM